MSDRLEAWLRGFAVAAGLVVAAIGLGVPSAWASSSPALPPSALRRLVVAPPPPFVALPDRVLRTGLMEFGNPKSGKIGTVVSTAQLKAAKFQRGWETVFQAPDMSAAYVDVFECATPGGANKLVSDAQSRVPSTYTTSPLDGLPGVTTFVGTSPDGHAVNGVVYSKGRFFVFQEVGGTPGAHDYASLLADLATRQTAALPNSSRDA